MGVLLEGLVEVAQAEKEDSVGVVPIQSGLDAQVLAADGCSGGHGWLAPF